MDWYPLLVGLLAGSGDAVVGKFGPTTGFLGRHKYLLYRGGLVAVGAYGEWTDHLSLDLRYGLMVAGTTLISQDIPNALSGGGLAAFGDVAISPTPWTAPAFASGDVMDASIANVRTQEMRQRNLLHALHPATAAG